MKFLILVFSVLCLVVFRAAFDAISFWYGDRIKSFFKGIKENNENRRLAAEYDKNYIKEKANAMRIEVVEVEEVNNPRNVQPRSWSWEVSHSSQLGERKVSTELIIIDNINN